ncbi:MAG: DUF917 domain-containing protein [Dongiaceae bacterium]
MSAPRELSRDDVEALATGAGILGTGGSAHPYLELLSILRLYDEGRRVSLLDPADLADDDLVGEVGFMGAPLITKERLPDAGQILKGFVAMQRHAGRPFRAVMSSEIGGENGVLPLLVAALAGVPMLDADPRGRAFPEMQMSSFAIAGLPLYPVALADVRNNAILITRSASPRWTERIGRQICIETGAMIANCKPPRTGRQIRDFAVLGSVSRAIRLGEAVRRARREHVDPIAALLAVEPGLRLFVGKTVDVLRRTTGGFVRGEATIEGLDDFAGQVFRVEFQNEFAVGWIDGRLTVMVPDLICILDAVTGEAIGTETIRYGHRVAIMSLPAAPVLVTEKALAVVGPRAFGYDIDFTSVHPRGAP